MQLTKFNSLMLVRLECQGTRARWPSSWPAVSLFPFSTEDIGKEEWCYTPQGLINNFGNKGFDKARGSGACPPKKRTGHRLSTPMSAVSLDKGDKVAEIAC